MESCENSKTIPFDSVMRNLGIKEDELLDMEDVESNFQTRSNPSASP